MRHIIIPFAAIAVSAAAADMPDTSKMNVLLIDIEDCNAAVWGCYGNPICKTPNIDRFASGAVRFDSAYCQAYCCNPTRTSFLTGLRPLTTGVLSNGHVMNQHLPTGVLTLPEMLKNKGLYTAVIGKLFHTVDYADRQLATFDRIEMYNKPKGWNGPGPIIDLPPAERARTNPPPPKGKGKGYGEWKRRQSDRYGDSGLAREQEPDYQKAQVAAALLKEFAKTKKQFFLAVAQARPHTPLIAPKKYIDMYDPAKIPEPPAPASSLRGFPYTKRATGGNPDIFTKQQPTAQQAREAIAAYYACVSFVDDNAGVILDALQSEGLDKNTIVIFLGDHGFHLGDHNFWSKYSMLEATRRVVFIVRVPGAPANGKACRGFVEFVDIVPTLAELLGLDAKNALEGTSLVPLLADPDRPWKKAVFMVDGNGDQVVRTKDFSYLEFKSGKADVPAALYDLRKDPWETINLAEEPAFGPVRDQMAGLLKAGWKAALPPGR
ncbi:MAG TPA: sulfatase [Verrucomicrobiae bacterium]|nr:sulfatase [Verrucomicrobiae bacterium]